MTMHAKSPLAALRLGNQHKSSQAVDDIITMLRKHPQSFDTVWLTTEFGFPTMDVHRQSAAMMETAAQKLRQTGMGITLQIANTIGHGVFMKSQSFEGLSSGRFVGDDGQVNAYCYCPRNTEFLEYTRNFVGVYAKACRPDMVFIDDDLRLFHDDHYGCFCDDCLSDFNRRYRHCLNREELVTSINDPLYIDIRKEWSSFCGESLAGVARAVAESVRDYAPHAVGALQHGGSMYQEYSPVYEVLLEVFGKPPHDRPGAGTYTDHCPRELTGKALELNRQIAQLPDFVKNIVPEIENYPHVSLGKSVHGTMVESALHLSYGCTGLSYATIVFDNEPAGEYEPMFARIKAWRDYFERLVSLNNQNKGTELGGYRIATPGRHGNIAAEELPFAWTWCNPKCSVNLVHTGLPVSFTASLGCRCSLLEPSMSDGMSEEELRELFRGSVITCGDTLMRLAQRGLSHLTGVTAWPRSDMADGEMLTDDPLNGEWPHRRFCYNLGGNNIQYVFECAQAYRPLARYYRVDESLAEVSSMLTDTPNGGRLAVFGYQMWNSLISSSRRMQLLNVADELSGNTLPAIIKTTAQAVCIPRIRREDGALKTLTILNESIDRTPPLQIVIRRPAGMQARLLRPMRYDLHLPFTRTLDELVVTLPELDGWQICTVVFED